MIDYNGKRNIFSKPQKRDNPVRIFIGLLVILGLLFINRGFKSGSLNSPFDPTPTPTRTFNSYAQEGETHFAAGNLDKAIEAYQNAVRIDPNNPELAAELVRIMVYSSTQKATDADKRARLEEAIQTANDALKLNPENSSLHAVLAFALDWYATPALAGDQWQSQLNAAEQEAVTALQFDSTNTLALAFYAEILVDQQKWSQADQYISQAMQKAGNLMDVYRVNGYVQESLSNYNDAITNYQKASAIYPNLNFLYISMGANYRQLANMALPGSVQQKTYFNQALDEFVIAVNINEQQGVQDPIPLISIANTYVQMGEFFSAARNMLKAVEYAPSNPTVYGQLGIVYYKARNYEGSILPLKCAIRGCTAAESCEVRNQGRPCDTATLPDIPIAGQPLSQSTVPYYFTYGSVLAGLHQPSNGYCEEAMTIFNEISQGFSEDTTIMSIVNEGESICKYYGYN